MMTRGTWWVWQEKAEYVLVSFFYQRLNLNFTVLLLDFNWKFLMYYWLGCCIENRCLLTLDEANGSKYRECHGSAIGYVTQSCVYRLIRIGLSRLVRIKLKLKIKNKNWIEFVLGPSKCNSVSLLFANWILSTDLLHGRIRCLLAVWTGTAD